MAAIKKALLQAFDALPKTMLRALLARKVEEAGVAISEKAMNALVDHILSRSEDTFVWDDDPKGEEKSVDLVFTDEDAQELRAAIEKVAELVPEAVLKASTAASDQMFKDLCERWVIEDAIQRYELDAFREGMDERWGKGLGYLRMLLTRCREVGQETWKRHAKSKSKRHMFRRWVLVRLHVRACQVVDEIVCLLENGFADGAMARWRTLHEISVIAALIADGDEETAERYILHDAVEVKRQADDFDETQVPLGFPPIGKRERQAIERNYNAAVQRFGQTFVHPYGWASKRLNHKKPTFKELQRAAGRASLSRYYKVASFNIHAGARSLFFNLSSMGDQDILVVGRSNAGLVEPGTLTAQALLLITSLYVGDSLNLDRITELNSLLRVKNGIEPALRRAERRLLRDEHVRQKQLAENRARTSNKLGSRPRVDASPSGLSRLS